MDDLLVIILTLIFAGIGALGQIKKKKQSQKNGQPAEEKQDNFWNFLDDEQGAKNNENGEVYETPRDIVQTPEQKVEPLTPQPNPRYEFKAENEGNSVYGNDLTRQQKKVKKEVKRKVKDFSLRKAVIYSEILNRKYH